MIKFLANNLIEESTITASTTNAQYPADNIKEDFRTKTWRSTSNSDNIVFDMGSTEPVDYIAIADNWRSGFGVNSITVEANATDSWGVPAFSTTLTFDSKFGIGMKSIAEQNYRFWRIVLTSTLGYCEIANFFIGKAVDITTNGIDYGWSYTNIDLKKVATSRYGQEFIDDIGQIKELSSLSINVMNTTELDQIFEVFDDRRTIKPLFIDFADDNNVISNNSNRFSGVYKFKKEPKLNNRASGFWNMSFSLREQK